MMEENLKKWLEEPYDEETKAEIRRLQQHDPETLKDAFYAPLQFGTGGLRGLMGIGTQRMNIYTVRAATQGLANVLLKQKSKAEPVLIGYDSRQNSRLFAEEAALVFAGNGIPVLFLTALRPSPFISFGCRYKKCGAAVMITASHNPPDYNGYKVFWSNGAQITTDQGVEVGAAIQKIGSLSQIQRASNLHHPLITPLLEELDEAYLRAIVPLQFNASQNGESGSLLNITYTPLHGAGIALVPQALGQAGFHSLHLVQEQAIPDGRFPTCPKPNPEELSALELGTASMLKTKSDLLLATDPDADRLGVSVFHAGSHTHLTGNQVACLCLHYILKQRSLPHKSAFIKSIATTELFKTLCEAYERPCHEVLIGSKHFAELIETWENTPEGPRFIFGAEESCGYLLDTQILDKDAITAAVLISEVALHAKLQGKTLVDLLHEIYGTYGLYYDNLTSLQFSESQAGREKILSGMHNLQKNPPIAFSGTPVALLEDFSISRQLEISTGKQTVLHLPKTDALRFWLDDGSKLLIRPSGTEPKIKIYCGVSTRRFASIVSGETALANHAASLVKDLQKYF